MRWCELPPFRVWAGCSREVPPTSCWFPEFSTQRVGSLVREGDWRSRPWTRLASFPGKWKRTPRSVHGVLPLSDAISQSRRQQRTRSNPAEVEPVWSLKRSSSNSVLVALLAPVRVVALACSSDLAIGECRACRTSSRISAIRRFARCGEGSETRSQSISDQASSLPARSGTTVSPPNSISAGTATGSRLSVTVSALRGSP